MTTSRIAWLASPLMLCALAAFSLVTRAADCAAADPDGNQEPPKDSLEVDYADQLPRIQPVSPDEALETFKVQPGFAMQQVAAEPLLADPTALAFDADGHLFVVEMRGYSEDPEDDLGRIRLLKDTDGDGLFDESSVYLDNLSWPTAVACWDGGVFVGVAPDILYCKDTDGDGRADLRKVVFSGFGRGNVQGLLNSFRWGLDNRLHGATSSSGATVKMIEHPDRNPLVLRGRDFAIDPRTMTIQPKSGGAQHGLSFDAWGNKFVCSNSDHAQLVMYQDHYIARNPYLAAPQARVSIASDGRQAPVYRASPVEPWRVVRTRLRVKGIVRGPVEGGGTPAGYFTGSTGITIYRGNAFPQAYRGNLFVADCGSNLVHRKLLRPDGVGQIADRADPQREFVASRDIWFRPVQMSNAPDGTLYIADMSREVIEHPKSLPPVIKKHLDLTSGRSRGRIYRVIPIDYKQPPLPRLSSASGEELAGLLAHPNGWHRDTALRLLYERQDRSTVNDLEAMAGGERSAVGRIHALCALDGLAALRGEVIAAAMEDEHPRVREHAVRLAEQVAASSPAVRTRLYRLVDDPDLRVRCQLAFSLGELSGRQRNEALVRLLTRDGADRWLRLAVQSSLGSDAGDVLALLCADADFLASKQAQTVLGMLAEQIGKQRNPSDLAALFKALQGLAEKDSGATRAIVSSVTKAAGGKIPNLEVQLAAATGGQAEKLLAELVASSLRIAQNSEVEVPQRVQAIEALSVGQPARIVDPLVKLIDYREPLDVQLAALSTLSSLEEQQVALTILDSFDRLSPRVRGEALEIIFSRPPWLDLLLSAIEQRRFPASAIDPARAALLRSHPRREVQQRAKQLFSASSASARQEVIEDYQPALEIKGDPLAGRKRFRKVCAACHRLEGVGHEIGKDLLSVREKSPEQIMLNVLDPNREVDPKYLTYLAITDDGRTLTGIIAAETATSITLKRAENQHNTLLRVNIEELKSTGKSIMPEALENEIDHQAMADLIAYLRSLR